MAFIDLHVHSTYSDGALTPAGLVDLANEIGLGAIALTDHDTAAGLDEALRHGERRGVEVIPGIEISSWHGAVPLHILGYWFRPDDPVFRGKLVRIQEGRRTRNMRIIENLNRLGIEVTVNELKRYSEYGQTGRPHIARLLVDKGVVRTVDQAFAKYLKRGAAAYAERFKYGAGEAISLIRGAGGITVLAHPACLDPSLAIIPSLLKTLQGLGLGGVEVYYPTHSKKSVQALKRIAEDLGLLMTGGTDFHGNGRSEVTLGGAKGFRVPGHLLATMKKRKWNS